MGMTKRIFRFREKGDLPPLDWKCGCEGTKRRRQVTGIEAAFHSYLPEPQGYLAGCRYGGWSVVTGAGCLSNRQVLFALFPRLILPASIAVDWMLATSARPSNYSIRNRERNSIDYCVMKPVLFQFLLPDGFALYFLVMSAIDNLAISAIRNQEEHRKKPF